MKTILVPTDFSEIAENAARYAISLANDLNANNILLYNAYQPPAVLTETVVPAMPLIDIETMKSISEDGMVAFREKLQEECPEGINLQHKTEFAILPTDINEICKDAAADLVVMGITGTSKIEEVLIGSTAISVMQNTKVPVIIVPANAKYTSIKNVMLACDYKNVAETIPVGPIKSILNATRAKLRVVNVHESDKQITADITFQQELLRSLLKEYEPEFTFVYNHRFIDGINEFVEANGIDLIITIPKKHKLFEGLFQERHTKKLAFHTHVPLMCIHREDV